MEHAIIIKPATPGGPRYFVEFVERNAKGERLIVEFGKTEYDNSKGYSLARLWKANGHIDRLIDNAWTIDTYCYFTDENGRENCAGRYNVQVKRGTIDFNWMLEATPENLHKIFEEIERRFFAA